MGDRYKKLDYGLGLLAMFFAFLSHTMFYLFPLFLEQFHPSKTRVGLIMGVYSLTAIMIRPFFGKTIDEWGPRKMSILSLVAMFVVVPFFHLVSSAGILAFSLRALMGVGWGVCMVAVMALCTDLAPKERLAYSLGVIGSSGIVAGAVGPMLAEQIVRYFGFGGLFNASLMLIVIASGCVVAIKEPPRAGATSSSSHLHLFRGHSWALLAIIGVMPVVHGAARGSVINFIVLYAKSVGFEWVAPFFIAFSAAAVLTRLGIGDFSDRFGRKKVILPSAILIGGNLFWLAGMHSYISFIICGFLAGLGQGLIFPALSAYLIDFLGHRHKSFALGLYMSLFDAGMGLGSPLFGWISDISSYRTMYVVSGALLIGYTVLFSLRTPTPSISK